MMITKILVTLYFIILSFTAFASCYEDTLMENKDSGQLLKTMMGSLFKVLPGDNIDSMLWLPITDLRICGPNLISHQGKNYQLFDIINKDDNEKVTAFKIK
ncbi:hypothetical protein OAI86_06415 [Alphaproteobacteria bacterium]|nr:hypothetical protein [Alphaproteobacteria bacterium]